MRVWVSTNQVSNPRLPSLLEKRLVRVRVLNLLEKERKEVLVSHKENRNFIKNSGRGKDADDGHKIRSGMNGEGPSPLSKDRPEKTDRDVVR